MKKAQLHHKGSDGKREEDSEAGNGDSPGTSIGTLVQALVAGVAFRGAHLSKFLCVLYWFFYLRDAHTSAGHPDLVFYLVNEIVDLATTGFNLQ